VCVCVCVRILLALGTGHLSLSGDSMRGTWWEGSFTGDPERYVKEIYQEM